MQNDAELIIAFLCLVSQLSIRAVCSDNGPITRYERKGDDLEKSFLRCNILHIIVAFGLAAIWISARLSGLGPERHTGQPITSAPSSNSSARKGAT